MCSGLEHQRQVPPVALTAREHAALLLLVSAREVESRALGAGSHRLLPELDLVLAAGDHLPYVLVRVEHIAALVNVPEFHGLADPDAAAVRLFHAQDHPEESRLSRAVRADDAHNAAWR